MGHPAVSRLWANNLVCPCGLTTSAWLASTHTDDCWQRGSFTEYIRIWNDQSRWTSPDTEIDWNRSCGKRQRVWSSCVRYCYHRQTKCLPVRYGIIFWWEVWAVPLVKNNRYTVWICCATSVTGYWFLQYLVVHACRRIVVSDADGENGRCCSEAT